MDDLSNFSTGSGASGPSRPSRKSTGIERSSRPVFDPGRVDEEEGWSETESLQLSQEQAEQLDTNREPGDVKYVMKRIEDPEQYLAWRSKIVNASYVDYRLIHEGNLKDRLRLHTGDHDVPSGRTDPNVDHGGETPFEVNVEDFRLMLSKNQTVFQVMFYEWSYADEDGGPGDSSMYSRRVRERPDGWISVSEASKIKDQTQSAITRAIRHGELTAVMEESETGASQKRWVRPDEDLIRWSPGRQKNYLLRRRLELTKEAIYGQLEKPRGARALSLTEIMNIVRKKEVREFGPQHTPDRYIDFFERQLDHPPESMKDWAKEIDGLVAKYCR